MEKTGLIPFQPISQIILNGIEILKLREINADVKYEIIGDAFIHLCNFFSKYDLEKHVIFQKDPSTSRLENLIYFGTKLNQRLCSIEKSRNLKNQPPEKPILEAKKFLINVNNFVLQNSQIEIEVIESTDTETTKKIEKPPRITKHMITRKADSSELNLETKEINEEANELCPKLLKIVMVICLIGLVAKQIL